MNNKKSVKITLIKNSNPKTTLEFPIVRIGVVKSIAGMWPNGK